jgi:hypothetical protein
MQDMAGLNPANRRKYMEAANFSKWVEDYRKAWLSNDPADIESLFTEDARYYTAPYRDPWEGRLEILRKWLENRDEPGVTEFSYTVIGVSGNKGFVQGRTVYTDEPPRAYRNLWVISLDEQGQSREFVEWYMKER